MIKPDPEAYYTESLAATGPYGHNGAVHYHNGGQGFDPCDFQTPILKRSRSDVSIPDTPDNVSRSKYRRWPSETETNSVIVSEFASDTIELLDDDNDYSKLKGVRYPGMGLFDSADSAQKRMRNQRKDDSVLKLMEQASSGIEPTEFVWTEDGEFQRTRDVYASPSIEGSPVCHSRYVFRLCFLQVWALNLIWYLSRTVNSRSAIPIGGSEAGLRRPQQHRIRHVRGRPRLGSLGRWHPVSRALWRETRFSKTMTMEAVESLAIATAPLRPTTSSAIRRNLVLVWSYGQALHQPLLTIMQPQLRVLSGSLGRYCNPFKPVHPLTNRQFRASPTPSFAVLEREPLHGIARAEHPQSRIVFPKPRHRCRSVHIPATYLYWPLFPAPADIGRQNLQSPVRSDWRWIL